MFPPVRPSALKPNCHQPRRIAVYHVGGILAVGIVWLATTTGVRAQELPQIAVSPSAGPAAAEIADKSQAAESPAVASPFAVVLDPERVTEFSYQLTIDGQILTPDEAGIRKWKLGSAGTFQFLQRRQPTELSGPLSLNAVRLFQEARVTTTVGPDHRTVVRLPSSLKTIRVTGSDSGLIPVSAESRPVSLTRQTLDLLQMPGDPLVCSGLMPSGDVKAGDKWNTDPWVVPLLTGLEAVTQQAATCEMKSLTDTSATVSFTATASGAVVGSASQVKVAGELKFDRQTGLITEYRATQTEERSAGPISPGLDVTVTVRWTQSEATTADANPALPAGIAATEPTQTELTLLLQTPWQLQLRHSREWHVFNQTSSLLLLRQIRNGNLIAQCNLSPGTAVAPGQQTSDAEFSADVQKAVASRDGQILQEETVRDDSAWRIRRVQAVSHSGDQNVFWNYYLCCATSGERYSFVFSHSEADAEEFGDEAIRILETLVLPRRRPAIPFQ